MPKKTNYKIKSKMSDKITNRKISFDNLGMLSELSNKTKQLQIYESNNTKDPFNMIIVGSTCCGKTYFLLSLLEQEYIGHFDYIFLICPTYEWNKTYQDWGYNDDEKFIVINCEQEDVESFLKQIVDFAKGTNSLIILDDCSSGKFVKNRTSEFINLAFSARHYGLSMVVITQQLTSVAKPYRENISRLVSFYNPNKKDMQIIFDNYLGEVSKEEKHNILEKLKNIKFSKLDINLRQPYSYTVE